MATTTPTRFIEDLVTSIADRTDTVWSENDWHGVDYQSPDGYMVRIYTDDAECPGCIVILFDPRRVEMTRATFATGSTNAAVMHGLISDYVCAIV